MPQVVVPGLKKRDQMMSAIPSLGRAMGLGAGELAPTPEPVQSTPIPPGK
jgi:hypothetical protein